MNSGKMVFSQIMDCLPWWRFYPIVKQHRGNHKVKHFSCAEPFLVMAFAQLTYRKSLRDVEAAFNAIGKKAYHMGIKCKISKSTLADANEQRNWLIYADFAQILIAQAKKLYADEPLDFQWDGEVYTIDATTIDHCLSVFPWAKFRRTKAAIKLHTKINLSGNIPEFIHISDGKLNDVNALANGFLNRGVWVRIPPGVVNRPPYFLYYQILTPCLHFIDYFVNFDIIKSVNH